MGVFDVYIQSLHIKSKSSRLEYWSSRIPLHSRWYHSLQSVHSTQHSLFSPSSSYTPSHIGQTVSELEATSLEGTVGGGVGFFAVYFFFRVTFSCFLFSFWSFSSSLRRFSSLFLPFS